MNLKTTTLKIPNFIQIPQLQLLHAGHNAPDYAFMFTVAASSHVEVKRAFESCTILRCAMNDSLYTKALVVQMARQQ